MDINEIKTNIQSFFDQGTITVVGSGLSCAEGIPGMRTLTDELIAKVPQIIDDENLEQWEIILNKLNKGIDLESVLQQEIPSEKLEKAIMDITYQVISAADHEIFQKVFLEKKNLRFAEYLERFNVNLYNIVVITTNYDLLIEYACEKEEIHYTDSFNGKIVAKFSPENARKEMIKGIHKSRNPKNIYTNHIVLYKPHGSINWKTIHNNSYRINHRNCGTPCLITPGSNKYLKGYAPPFDYHIGRMGEEIDSAKRIVFIGYGFNDNHLETHLSSSDNLKKPMLIITRSLSKAGKVFLNKNSNTMALEHYMEGDECGTMVHWKGSSMKIQNVALWDLRGLIREVF